jgi:hypothetical protein
LNESDSIRHELSQEKKKMAHGLEEELQFIADLAETHRNDLCHAHEMAITWSTKMRLSSL